MLLQLLLVDLRVGVVVAADVLLLLGVLVSLSLSVDVDDLGVLRPDDEELHGGFGNLRN